MSLSGGFSGGQSANNRSDKGLRMSLSDTIRLAWADDDLRRRLLFILFIFAVYVLGVHVPAPIPGFDPAEMTKLLENNQFFNLLNTIGGGAFKRVSIFALGLGPYITASIIMQVLSMGIPSWKQEMQEGGEYARKQQNKRTRGLTLALCLGQGFGLLQMMGSGITGRLSTFGMLEVCIFWMAGSMFLLWLGEQVSEKGIGNGISILIFAGIVISLPNVVMTMYNAVAQGTLPFWQPIIIVLMFIFTTWLIVMFTIAQRRIPIQHMRRQFGTKTMGGQTSYLPISLGMAGVIPVIFAISLIYMPAQFAAMFPANSTAANTLNTIGQFFSPDFTHWQGWIGALIYMGLIFMFTYLWTALQYNVEDISNNLKRGGSYIPGVRPGKQTKEFLDSVISKVTFVGAFFLALIAMTQFIFPLIAPSIRQNLGLIAGTSLLIMVSVALETMRQIEANLLTKQYGQ